MAGVQLPKIGSIFMNTSWALVLGYSSIPVKLILIRGILSFLKTYSPALTSVVQQFATGVGFAAISVQLIPCIN